MEHYSAKKRANYLYVQQHELKEARFKQLCNVWYRLCQTRTTAYCMIASLWHSGKDQWLPGAGSGGKRETTRGHERVLVSAGCDGDG